MRQSGVHAPLARNRNRVGEGAKSRSQSVGCRGAREAPVVQPVMNLQEQCLLDTPARIHRPRGRREKTTPKRNRERTRGMSSARGTLNTTPCLPRLARRTINAELPLRAGLPVCKQRPSNTDIPAHTKALLVAEGTSLQPRPLSLAKIRAKAPRPPPRLPSRHTPRPPRTHYLSGSSHALRSAQKKPKK
ncbi:hypothetical protein B0H14DRAFT_2950132 [Mycena olivaceomarginata]|nr:hypothetical protein B0H14DRAFT_2950132 [Mycena olivaceomarginata]